MNKFCPKCGKKETKNNKLIQGLCKNCFSEKSQMLKEYKPLKIIICQQCKSYLYQNKWQPKLSNAEDTNIREIIKRLLPKKLKFTTGTKVKNININPIVKDTKGKKTIDTEVSLHGSIRNLRSKEKHQLQILKEDSICNICKKKNSSYYEAVMQIRPKNNKLLNFIKQDLASDRKTFITKQEEKKFGYDLYITSKNYLQSVLPKIKKKFNTETKISTTLYGRKDGRNVYRITALIRLKE